MGEVRSENPSVSENKWWEKMEKIKEMCGFLLIPFVGSLVFLFLYK